MTSPDMDVGAYLTRIGFSGPTEPTLDVLQSVHLCHLMSVPFENLTQHSGGRVQLDLPVLYDKIVKQHRGGFCCENNGLFFWLLGKLGFQVTLLSGQVKYPVTGVYGPSFDHMIIMVVLDGKRWLCDVGFYPGFVTPLLLETSDPQQQGHKVYRIRQAEGMNFLEVNGDEHKETLEGWSEIFKFTLQPRRMADFYEMCQYHQTSPSSPLACKSLCMMLKPGGRLSLMGRKLTTTTYPTEGKGLEKTTRELQDEEIQDVLAKDFGVVLKSQLIVKDDVFPPPSVLDSEPAVSVELHEVFF